MVLTRGPLYFKCQKKQKSTQKKEWSGGGVTTVTTDRARVSAYIKQYNKERPHEALEYKTPSSVYFDCFVEKDELDNVHK